ncbi:uncharacterized protein [Pseudochaenichthys georgianus]|uniref:uncharacterized protein n=1 Tax=Pseudochaenichthys georgianus TaxID=52239 RepID=UPI0039C225E4
MGGQKLRLRPLSASLCPTPARRAALIRTASCVLCCSCETRLTPTATSRQRPLRGSLSFVNRLEKFSNPHIRLLWREAWAAKEDALRTRMSRTTESLGTHSRPLRPLALGERVFLQNQQGPSPHKWDRSGIVVESPGHDQYRIRVDGSGRLTLRNRRFLRAYTPATPCAREQPAAPLPPPAALDHEPPPIHPGWATPQGIAQRPAVGPRDSAPFLRVPSWAHRCRSRRRCCPSLLGQAA